MVRVADDGIEMRLQRHILSWFRQVEPVGYWLGVDEGRGGDGGRCGARVRLAVELVLHEMLVMLESKVGCVGVEVTE